MTDVARLRKALEYAHAHPELHYQGEWAMKTACGTTMCLAGTVAWQAGYRFIWMSDNSAAEVRGPDGDVESVESAAWRLLDLDSSYQANALFYEAGNIENLYWAANEITDGEIEIPLELQ